MPQWYIDWLIATLVPLALRGSWEAGIDPLEPGYEPQTQPEQHGVGIVGKWALEKAFSPHWREELTMADYAMSFWYIVEGEKRMVRWQVLGHAVFSRLCS